MTSSLWDQSLRQFRKHLAADRPTPGGGALAAASGSLAAALLRMVCAISRRKASAANQSTIDAIERHTQECESVLAQCADDDVRAFDAYMSARKSSPAEAQRLLLLCAEVPMRGAETVAESIPSLYELEDLCPTFARSDLTTARSLLRASLESLLANVAINLDALDDGEGKRALQRRFERLSIG